jgi:hypothetical protein
MTARATFTSLAVLVAIIACTGINLPSPITPVLQTVNLHGMAACPTTTDGSCPLPTTSATTWALDPEYYNNSAGNLVFNRRAVIVVDVPALTDLTLTNTAKGQNHAMVEQPGTYPADTAHYTTQHTDNGETRRWFLTVATHACDNPTTYHVVDVGRQLLPPSAICSSGSTWCCPGASSSGPSTPSTTGGSGASSCPSGEQHFKICEKCQASVGATPIYNYYEACYSSWSTAQTVHGMNGCTITQVSGPSQCQLP